MGNSIRSSVSDAGESSSHYSREAVLCVPNKITRSVLLPGKTPPSYNAKTFPHNLRWIPGKKISWNIPVLYFPKENADLLVIGSHGNGTDIGEYQEYTENFHRAGASVLWWEYPGYGISLGTRTVANVNHHADGVLSYVENELKWPMSKVVLFGHSIGSGSAIRMNAKLQDEKKTVAGVILQSPYTSTTDVGHDIAGSVSSVMTEGWDNLSEMPKVHSPLLIFHGEKDGLIKVEHSRELIKASVNTNQKKLVTYPKGDHNNLDWSDMFKQTREFIAGLRDKK